MQRLNSAPSMENTKRASRFSILSGGGLQELPCYSITGSIGLNVMSSDEAGILRLILSRCCDIIEKTSSHTPTQQQIMRRQEVRSHTPLNSDGVLLCNEILFVSMAHHLAMRLAGQALLHYLRKSLSLSLARYCYAHCGTKGISSE